MRPIHCCLLLLLPHLSSMSWRSRLLQRRRIPEQVLMLRAAEGCNLYGFLPLRRLLGRGVGYHERNEIWFNRNSGLQETCADAIDCDAVLASLFNDLLLYCKPNPMLPFPAFDSATITAEKDAISRCQNFGSAVPFCLLQSNDVTTFCSTPPVLSTYPLHTNSWCGKERRILIGPW